MHHFDLDVNLKIFKTRIYYLYGKLKKKNDYAIIFYVRLELFRAGDIKEP